MKVSIEGEVQMSLYVVSRWIKQILKKTVNLSLSLIIGLSSLGVAAPMFFSQHAYAAPLNVCTTFCNYTDIQTAINDSPAGGIVNISGEHFSGAITINKNLTIIGAGAGSTFIDAPGSLPAEGAIVNITGAGVHVDISGLTVVGPGPSACGSIMSGIFVENGADANIHDMAVTSVRDSSLSGCQNGRAILVGWGHGSTITNTTGTATVSNVVINDYQKAGVEVSGAGSSATVTGNIITGIGATGLIAANGIEVTFGASADVSGNTVTANSYTGSDFATGILLYQPGAGTTVGANSVSGNQIGLWTNDQPSLNSINVTGISGNTRNIVADTTGWTAPTQTLANAGLSGSTSNSDGADLVAGAGGLYAFGFSAFTSVSQAITAAAASGTVNIAAGHYSEYFTIGTNNLTLVGAGPAATFIDAPSNLPAEGTIVTISASGVDMSGLTVEGPGPTGCGSLLNGIYVKNGSANLHDMNVSNIGDNVPSGCQNGVGIRVGRQADSSTGTATINNVIVSNYQKGGIVVDNTGSSATITNNTVTGRGTITYNAENGIQVSRGATATISSNTVTGNSYHDDSNPSNWSATGVLLFQSGAVTMTGDTISDNDLNVYKYDNSGSLSLTHESLGSSSAPASFGFIVFNGGSDAIIATNNYWGSAAPDFGAIVSGSVNFEPWYSDAAKTTLVTTTSDVTPPETSDGGVTTSSSSIILTDDTSLDLSASVNTASPAGDITVDGVSQDLTSYTGGNLTGVNLDGAQSVGGVDVTVTQAVNLQSGSGDPIALTNSDLANVNVSIPNDTTVLAGSSWDGTIAPPTASSDSSGTAPSGFSVGSTVVEVGSPGTVLLFDKAVTVTLTGVTGPVAYRPAGSTVWTQITTVCGGTYASPTDPVFPGECAITDGTNTKILTYHFTSFAGLNANPTPTPSSNSSTSSSGGSSSSTTPAKASSSSSDNSNSNPAEVLGSTAAGGVVGTALSNTKTPVVVAKSVSSNKFLGVAWYLWLIGLAVLAGAGYFVYKQANTVNTKS